MSVSVVVLSKDRPAQLRLLLDSLDANGHGYFQRRPIVIAKGSSVDRDAAAGGWLWQQSDSFESDVRLALDHCGEAMCFMCDDGILYRRPQSDPARALIHAEVICHSLRLGANTTVQYPTGLPQTFPGRAVRWRNQPSNGDFGYPGSVDAHVFRTADVRVMLRERSFPNPTALELALVAGCEQAYGRDIMSCDHHSSYVGVPVNRTSEQSRVRHGAAHPFPAGELERLWRDGYRIDLRRIDFALVDGAHTELELPVDRRAAVHV